MAQGIEDNGDDLLLLTMRLETDDDDFSKARREIKQLQESMQDIESGINLNGLISGLNKAANVLRKAVDSWNSLEDKALTVATNRNYLPYGITSGEAESIRTKIDANKGASNVGFTGSSMLNALSGVASAQAATEVQGEAPKTPEWVALYTLAQEMGNTKLQGSSMANLLLHSTSIDVVTEITSLLADASRKAYTLSGEDRQALLNKIVAVANTSYVPKGAFEYISAMTKPENKTWGRSGNPIIPVVSGTAEDVGSYGTKIETATSKSLSLQAALSYLKTESDEFTNLLSSSAYNFIGENVVLPLAVSWTKIAGRLGGKTLSNQTLFEGIPKGLNPKDYIYYSLSSAVNSKKYATLAGLDETATMFKGDLESRTSGALHYVNTDNALLGELGLYEASKLAQTNFAEQSITAMVYAREALARNVTSNYTYTEGKRKGKKYTKTDASKAAEELLFAENSPYVSAYASGGFSGLYSELYKNQALTEKEYLTLMERVVNDTKHKELSKFYPDVSPTEEVTAKTKEVNGKQVLQLELTIVNAETGKKETVTQELTAEELASLRLNLGI